MRWGYALKLLNQLYKRYTRLVLHTRTRSFLLLLHFASLVIFFTPRFQHRVRFASLVILHRIKFTDGTRSEKVVPIKIDIFVAWFQYNTYICVLQIVF